MLQIMAGHISEELHDLTKPLFIGDDVIFIRDPEQILIRSRQTCQKEADKVDCPHELLKSDTPPLVTFAQLWIVYVQLVSRVENALHRLVIKNGDKEPR